LAVSLDYAAAASLKPQPKAVGPRLHDALAVGNGQLAFANVIHPARVGAVGHGIDQATGTRVPTCWRAGVLAGSAAASAKASGLKLPFCTCMSKADSTPNSLRRPKVQALRSQSLV
jgi:hypothetical protein